MLWGQNKQLACVIFSQHLKINHPTQFHVGKNKRPWSLSQSTYLDTVEMTLELIATHREESSNPETGYGVVLLINQQRFNVGQR